MPQFFVPRKNIRGSFFVFDESESGHLSRVLRKRPGEVVQIFDGEGWVSWARLEDLSDPASVRGAILEGWKGESASGIVLNLYPALLKGPRFEWLLEKASELGVGSVHPVTTARTVVKVSQDGTRSKLERWNKILLSAAKQCGRTGLPSIHPPQDFRSAVQGVKKSDTSFILWEGEEQNHLSGALRQDANPVINLFVGPEGGFAIGEFEAAQKAGIQPVRIGENILRAETAGIAAISYLLLHRP